MRRLWTVLLVTGVAATAVTALVDAVIKVREASPRSQGEAVERSRPARLPPCSRDQLALVLETLGGGTSVALQHVQGRPCHRSPLTLSARVTNSHGVRSELPLGEARLLEGDFSPGFEQLVGLTFCGSAPPFVVEATAGPYTARGEGRFGANCESAQREATVVLGSKPGSKRFRIDPLDPSTHEVSFLIDLPQRANIRVIVRVAAGPRLEVLDGPQRRDCRRTGRRDACQIRLGLLGEEAGGRWTLIVRKRSSGPAVVRFSVAFIAANA